MTLILLKPSHHMWVASFPRASSVAGHWVCCHHLPSQESTVRRWSAVKPAPSSDAAANWGMSLSFPHSALISDELSFHSSVRWRVWAALLARNQCRQSGSSVGESPCGQGSGENNQKEPPCTSQGPRGGGDLFEENPTERWLMEVRVGASEIVLRTELVPPRPLSSWESLLPQGCRLGEFLEPVVWSCRERAACWEWFQ